MPQISRFFLSLLIGAFLLFLTACETTMTNRTPVRVPQNPSGIYTLSYSVKFSEADIIEDSIQAWIIIDEQKHKMTNSESLPYSYEYEYRMPPHRKSAKYYYVIDYAYQGEISRRERQITSRIFDLNLTNRYVITMQSTRGPVGATIPVVGRGFSRFDKIVVGGVEVETEFDSDVALNFTVPSLPAGKSYPVSIITGSGDIPVGDFHIDASQIFVHPSAISLQSGKKGVMLFSIQRKAPPGGLYIDVSTNIPSSIIMPEVIIPGGSKTISVPVTGGQAGSGILYITAPGFDELQIPLSVTGDEPEAVESTPISEVQAEERSILQIHPAPAQDEATSLDEETADALILEE